MSKTQASVYTQSKGLVLGFLSEDFYFLSEKFGFLTEDFDFLSEDFRFPSEEFDPQTGDC